MVLIPLYGMIQYNQGAAWQRLDIITAQSVFQLPKIDKENFSTFRPSGRNVEKFSLSIYGKMFDYLNELCLAYLVDLPFDEMLVGMLPWSCGLLLWSALVSSHTNMHTYAL